jgi:hypothetical protein
MYEFGMFRVAQSEEQMMHTKLNLEDVTMNVVCLRSRVQDPELRKCVEQIEQKLPIEALRDVSPITSGDRLDSKYRKADYNALVTLNKDVKEATLECNRA